MSRFRTSSFPGIPKVSPPHETHPGCHSQTLPFPTSTSVGNPDPSLTSLPVLVRSPGHWVTGSLFGSRNPTLRKVHKQGPERSPAVLTKGRRETSVVDSVHPTPSHPVVSEEGEGVVWVRLGGCRGQQNCRTSLRRQTV